ncbi:MAG: glycosyltransferase family 2 protein [Pyrinomonadaceae bacterium]
MDEVNRPRIIVLVPIRNEAWILKTFLECASLWADHIIIADQVSTDGSREIAAAFPKVTVIENPSSDYSEVDRQLLLIEEARRFPAPRLLIAIDADEILSANILNTVEWETAMQQPPGTVLGFAKVELYGSIAEYFLHSVEDKNSWIPFGYVDDGALHEGKVIHTSRIPEQVNSPRFSLKDVVVIHFARLNMLRAESKDRWYRCFERISFPEKNILTIHRSYDFFERLKNGFRIRRTRADWFGTYEKAGINLNINESDNIFWWDWDILRLFQKHGTAPFRYLDIWSVDWEALRARGLSEGIPGLPEKPIRVPLSWRDRLIRATLQWPHARGFVDRIMWRLFRYGII